MNINELREKRVGLASRMRALLDAAQAQNRGLTKEESAKFDAMNDDLDKLDQLIKREERMETIDKFLNESAGRKVVSLEQSITDVSLPQNTKQYRKAFTKYLRGGKTVLSPEEYRDLSAGSTSAGGYLTYDEFERRIVELLQQENVIRRLATVITTGGDRNIPVETSVGTANWMTENGTYVASDASFGQVTLGAYKLGTIIKVSEELVTDASFDLPNYLAGNFARRFATAEETAFCTGSGVNQPTGIATACTVGVTTASSSAITGDELLDLYHSVLPAYRNSRSVAWLFNDATIKVIRQIKELTTGSNQYLWQPGMVAGAPDTLFGKPVYATSFATIAPSEVVGAFGDISYYWIADRGNRVMQVLNELYAATGQVAYRMFERLDANITNTAAIRTIKMKAN